MAKFRDPCVAGSNRGIPRSPVRGREFMRDPRKACHDNATRYTVSSQDTRTVGWPWLATVLLRFNKWYSMVGLCSCDFLCQAERVLHVVR